MKKCWVLMIVMVHSIIGMNEGMNLVESQKVDALKKAVEETRHNVLMQLSLKLVDPTYRFPQEIRDALQKHSLIDTQENINDQPVIIDILASDHYKEHILHSLSSSH